MIRTINEVSDGDFETEVGQYLHLQFFIRHLAVERFISDIDGFLGDWGPNNFYLYRFEGGTLSAIIPWDKDSTFYDLLDDIYKGFDRSVLGQRILALPALRRYYLESLLGCAASVAEPDAPGFAASPGSRRSCCASAPRSWRPRRRTGTSPTPTSASTRRTRKCWNSCATAARSSQTWPSGNSNACHR